MSDFQKAPITNVTRSLNDLLGAEYLHAVCEAKAFLTGEHAQTWLALADQPVEFYPAWFQQRGDELVDQIGKQVCPGYPRSAQGASTKSFVAATKTRWSPLSGFGCFRLGEDGKLYLITKSEHYHASLGHSFPGYNLIDYAKKLGVPNATHNSTRGYITRLLEQELIRLINGLDKQDVSGLQCVLNSTEPHVLNRVLNLETGSLAVEAALKMMLARFYQLDKTFNEPLYAGKIPVVLVIADYNGGKEANYHGTTVLTQMMRGMWPAFFAKLETAGAMVVKSVRINDAEHFDQLVKEYDAGNYKIAGFFHEIILMNYGGVRLTEKFLHHVYAVCQERDIPTMVDEIQSCIWSPELFLFREYGLSPDLVSLGKGFPGGEYPASRLITTAQMDNLNQFGALVTNGQEELASLAYLITIEFAMANKDYTKNLGDFYENALRKLTQKYAQHLERIEGRRHLSSLYFYSTESAVKFCKLLTDQGIDISAQTYKANCPPSALTKLPLTCTPKMIEFLIDKMDDALKHL
ncbi:predicted CDS Pa_7_10880 [Candidatus Vecturithrix granuli]|uniref:Predicted CDS Pa_7_10880 n=1 Tax=Vecturithrix granuli TaxID=1499967 RepID=A0A081BUT5_VECG1|nr:predicted CDS Pa_7_10880 [Candidatus Vecturithrix granuli]